MRQSHSAVTPLAVLVLLAVLVVLSGCAEERGPRPAGRLLVGQIVEPEGGDAARRGGELGAAEALRAATLLGREFELRTVTAATPREAERAARRLIRHGAFALVGGGDEEVCGTLSEVAERNDILYLNTNCRADRLRGSRALTFHVEASDGMYGEAQGVRRVTAANLPAVTASLWHAGLTRYGATQLNDRFVRSFGEAPGSMEWANWMAVKVLWEAALRTGGTDAAAIADYLREEAEFDGHKGEALRFDPESHQLTQPLYLVTGTGELAAEFRGDAEAEGELPRENEPVGPGRYVLVSAEGSRTVTVIDLESGDVASTFRLPARPRGIHVSPDGSRAYVALSDDEPLIEGDADGIAVIDLRQGRLVRTFPAGSDPEAFAVSPEGQMLYASNEDAGTATVLDMSSGAVVATLVVGVEPEGVAISPDGRWVYVTAETSNTVSVIDTRTNRVTASFMVDVRPRAAAFSPDGRRAYVTNEISGTLSVVDVARHEVIGTVELHQGKAKPVGVVVSPDGRHVWVANGHANSVSVVDTRQLREIALVEVGRRPWGIGITADGSRVFTANGLSNDVSVIDAASRTVVGTVQAGRRPWGIAVTR
jgi:PQQ-dependent catabolism-associated beta-propeller protein